MKKTFCFLIFVSAVVFSAAADGPRLTVVTNTGFDIYYLYVSSVNDDEWGDDLLGDDVLEDGDSWLGTVRASGKWDVQAVDEDGDSYTFAGVDITKNMTLIITLDDLD